MRKVMQKYIRKASLTLHQYRIVIIVSLQQYHWAAGLACNERKRFIRIYLCHFSFEQNNFHNFWTDVKLVVIWLYWLRIVPLGLSVFSSIPYLLGRLLAV